MPSASPAPLLAAEGAVLCPSPGKSCCPLRCKGRDMASFRGCAGWVPSEGVQAPAGGFGSSSRQ